MQGACVCMKSICYTDAKSSVVRAQDFTCVAEAALAEKALSLSKELEAGVAGIMNLFDKHWPAGLGTLEEVKSMLSPCWRPHEHGAHAEVLTTHQEAQVVVGGCVEPNVNG